MAREKSSKLGSKTLPVTIDAHGNVAYVVILKQNDNAKRTVYTQHKDLVPKFLKNDKEENGMDDDEERQIEIEKTTWETKATLEKITNVRLSATQQKNVPKRSFDPKVFMYIPPQQSSGAKRRIIRMVEMHVDPLEPVKCKNKIVSKAKPYGSFPVLMLRSLLSLLV